jgi:hypothetical protein
MVAPSLALASAQYCRPPQLKQSISIRGVRCTTNQNHDVGRFTTYSLSSLENGATRRGTEAFRGLEVDDLVYKERFIVRISHIGVNKTATIETIASFLQVFLFSFQIQQSYQHFVFYYYLKMYN